MWGRGGIIKMSCTLMGRGTQDFHLEPPVINSLLLYDVEAGGGGRFVGRNYRGVIVSCISEIGGGGHRIFLCSDPHICTIINSIPPRHSI